MDNIMKINVRIEDGCIVTDSRNIADTFEKRHDHVLRDIENIKKDLPNFGEMFIESTMPDNYGRNQKVYFVSRDGFSLLAMGFTGSKALEWKLKYINAFNTLEKAWNTPEQIMARALKVADAQIISLKDRCNFLGSQIEEKSQLIESLQPKAAYYDLVLQCNTLLSTTEIAKDYGMSARKFNDLLHEMGIQFKQSDRWFLYTRYEGCGYTSSKTTNFVRKDGSLGCATNMYWTPKGRLFLYDSLKSDAILPMIEREIA